MRCTSGIAKLVATAGLGLALALPALAAEDTLPDSKDRPGGFPERPLTMVVPYGPGGGSGQVAAAMAQAVTELTDVGINRDHKPGGSGMVGLTAYMAMPADGYTVLEHIDDATSAFVSGSGGRRKPGSRGSSFFDASSPSALHQISRIGSESV